MSRPVRDKTPTEPLNYAFMGGKNPTMSVSAPKKRVSARYHYEEIDDDGGSPSFPTTASTATQPPPIGPFLPDYYAGGVVKVKKVKYNDNGGKHTVFADEDE